MFVVISYYTSNTGYREAADMYLRPSVEALNLPHKIYEVPNAGSWIKNTALKPRIILEAMAEFPKADIAFVDADAEIRSYPYLFDHVGTAPLSAHFLDWQAWYGRPRPRRELLSGTLMVFNNPAARALVSEWAEASAASIRWEQAVLEDLVYACEDIEELPIEYCWINTMPDGSAPRVKCEAPVIVHHQVSRRLKHTV